MTMWKDVLLSDDATYFHLDGHLLFGKRFLAAMKFHAPGLAPVQDASGWYHIDLYGEPVYPERYLKTFGYYEGLAAVQDSQGFFHIGPDGKHAYTTRYAWCGNFQQGRCVARHDKGHYRHILVDGHLAYKEPYAYAGDYKDGVACVRRFDGECHHIRLDGTPLHGQGFLDLGVYHKGFATARDAAGWFHIDRAGKALYSNRFASLEPFYNGVAYAEDFHSKKVLVHEDGHCLILSANSGEMD